MKRHPLAQRFHDILVEIGRLHDIKQKDYSSNRDPFANLRKAEAWGVPPWVYAMMRVDEKITRLQTLRHKGKLENEKARESFRDIAVYALIAEILFDEINQQIGQYTNFINFSEFSKSIKLNEEEKHGLSDQRCASQRCRHKAVKIHRHRA